MDLEKKGTKCKVSKNLMMKEVPENHSSCGLLKILVGLRKLLKGQKES